MQGETRIRSIIKAVTWRVVATLATMILVFVLTGHLRVAIAVGGFEIIIKFLLYFLHERFWNKIETGRIK